MAGRRVNLATLAGDPGLDDARVPGFVDDSPRSARLVLLAPNPLNARDVAADSARIADLAESMREQGQLQPCAVVSRTAFLNIFPDHEPVIGRATFVQVTGGRRYAAAKLLEWPALDIAVKDALAESRVRFISATAAENIDRQDYDPVEEARQVQALVTEAGSGKAAAEALTRTPAWVTQRLNLLKLIPQVQTALRAGEIPLREVRTLHTLAVSDQLAALQAWTDQQTGAGLTAVNRQSSDDEAVPDRPQARSRPSVVAAAIRRLGGTPDKIAASLRAELSTEEVKALIKLLRS